MELNVINVVVLIAVGIVSGFINTVAGGGSSITLPVLMFLGLPPAMANGTNRIAILLQSFAGAETFRKKGLLSWKEGKYFLIPSVVGAMLGAIVAIVLTEKMMHHVILAVMVAMFFLVLFKPEAWIRQDSSLPHVKRGVMQWGIYFAIGFYGGFIQVGVGFLLLAGLVLGSGYGVVKANGLKVLIVLFYTGIALLVFWSSQNIHLASGLVLGIASMAGAYAGARFTIQGGVKWIRLFLLVVLFAIIVKLTGIVF